MQSLQNNSSHYNSNISQVCNSNPVNKALGLLADDLEITAKKAHSNFLQLASSQVDKKIAAEKAVHSLMQELAKSSDSNNTHVQLAINLARQYSQLANSNLEKQNVSYFDSLKAYFYQLLNDPNALSKEIIEILKSQNFKNRIHTLPDYQTLLKEFPEISEYLNKTSEEYAEKLLKVYEKLLFNKDNEDLLKEKIHLLTWASDWCKSASNTDMIPFNFDDLFAEILDILKDKHNFVGNLIQEKALTFDSQDIVPHMEQLPIALNNHSFLEKSAFAVLSTETRLQGRNILKKYFEILADLYLVKVVYGEEEESDLGNKLIQAFNTYKLFLDKTITTSCLEKFKDFIEVQN